ncbi:MAG: hypothetical protein LBB57_02415 [Clostridiales Family XIII bacterium]|jgi:Na+-driven multidrug efflux pump/anti-sigma regulatory factor (Ser/Thr protein kinase)|nr:hypothetical protein [Clostridiales Family XIII bacterium]
MPNDAFIGKVVARYAAPSVLSMIGTRISSLANSLILGNLIGEKGLSTLSIVTPVSLVYLSLGALIGVGASVVSGIALGRGDRDACDRVYTLAYALSLLTGLLMMAAGLLGAGKLAAALGAEGEIFPLVRDYIKFMAVGGVFTVLLYTPLNYLRLCGKPGRAMALLLIMSFANTVFSAFFVMALDMRTDGVALGGGVGSLSACLFGVYSLWGARSQLRIRPRGFTVRDLRAIPGAGSVSALNNICRSVQYACLNLLIVRIAPRILPAYAVVCAAQDMFLAVLFGFSQILLPLASISYGEKDGRCIRILTKRILLSGSLSVGVCALLLLLFCGRIDGLFGIRDGPVSAELQTALFFMALGVNLSFINNMACSYFNVTRRTSLAVMMTLCRLLIFTVIPAYALAGSLGAGAVWICAPASELLSLAALAAALFAIRARDKSLSRFWLLDGSFTAGKNTIDFSVANTNEAAAFASARIADFCEANEIPAQQSLCLSLSIEEMLLLINAHSLPNTGRTAFADLRVTAAQQGLTLRIRNAGKRFNPLETLGGADAFGSADAPAGTDALGVADAPAGAVRDASAEDGPALAAPFSFAEEESAAGMGMKMILRMAKKVEYKEVFGVNNLSVTI